MKRMWSRRELVEQAKNVKKDISTLVDAQGHDRFIEGDIDIIETTGVTKKYGKWALSGSHLLIVLACEVASGATIAGKRCVVNVPKWIQDKIYQLFSTLVIYKTEVAFGDDFSSQTMTFYLQKSTIDGEISIHNASITMSAKRNFRVAFDLLIDAE